MSIEFINDHGVIGVDVSQDGNLIAWIRYTKLFGYVIDYEKDTSLDINEQEQILEKMKELQREVNYGKKM